MPATTYTKLKSGEWGLRVPGGAARAGMSVAVHTKAGAAKTETIDRVLWSGNGVSLCTIRKRQRSSYGGDGFRPVAGCGNCRAIGRMCKQCEFDEYDM